MKLKENKYWSNEEEVAIDSLERNTAVIISSCSDDVWVHIPNADTNIHQSIRNHSEQNIKYLYKNRNSFIDI